MLEKKYKLVNSQILRASEVSVEDLLIAEHGPPKKLSSVGEMKTTMVYEIQQAPFGDSYFLGEEEKISLMLMYPPKLIFVPSEDLQKKGEYLVTGHTKDRVWSRSFSDLDLAKRTLRDFLQPGAKLDLTLKEYLLRSEEWKKGFGGYFLPLNFSKRGKLPFDPRDVPYLNPEDPGKKYLESPKEDRLNLLRGYVDRFGKSEIKENLMVFEASVKTLETIRTLGKSLGMMVGPLDQPGTYGMVYKTSPLGHPSNAYPISVIPYGVMEIFVTPGISKVLFEDGTVGWY